MKNGQRMIEPIIKQGEQVYIQLHFSYDEEPFDVFDMRAFIIDNHLSRNMPRDYQYDIIQTLYEEIFDSDTKEDDIISFTTCQLGEYGHFTAAYFGDDGSKADMSKFAVVEKMSKAFGDDNKCRNELKGLVKSNYLEAVCVIESTGMKLLERGWKHPFAD